MNFDNVCCYTANCLLSVLHRISLLVAFDVYLKTRLEWILQTQEAFN